MEIRKEKAIFVGVIKQGDDERQIMEYLDELEFLAETAGAEGDRKFIQKVDKPDSRTYIRSGKLTEIKEYIEENEIDLVIFDDELSPTQLRNIERELQIRILDRTNLILDIFAQRAKTAYAKTQVELAQYQYLLPRLTRMWTHLERQKGGIGMRGPGETQIETDRRIIQEKIARLKEGIVPIYEPGLGEMIRENLARGALHFTDSKQEALQQAEVIFIAVGTPMGEDGGADLSAVYAVAKDIGEHLNAYSIVVDKSTVPVGTAKQVRAIIQKTLDSRGVNIAFDVVSNPEFLKEGAAIKDFISPDRVVIGSDSQKAIRIMKELYAPFLVKSDRFITMSIESAEMTKYAANAMLATKISFISALRDRFRFSDWL